jgi:hypothetical protein
VHTIGMRVPITVAFLDASWRVTRLERAAPGRLLVSRHARCVFECHVGANIRLGDVLTIPGRPRFTSNSRWSRHRPANANR